MQSRRFLFIDALRGIASLGVVLFHAVEGNHINLLPAWVSHAASFGGAGVPLFFVISGFVIAHSLQDRRMTVKSLGKFMLRRSIRLDPPYWVAIAVAISFSLLASKVVAGRAMDEFSIGQVVAHLGYVQNILGFKNINQVFWTLCYEVQFYIVFGILLFTTSRISLPIAFLISLLWCYRLAPDTPAFFPNLWFAFLLGTCAWYAWVKPSTIPVGIAYFLAVAIAALWYRDSFATACCISAAAIYAVARAGSLSTTLSWKPLQFLGAISYSLYLLHNPITGAVFRVGRMIGPASATTQAVLWVCSIAACILASWVLYVLVEQPCVRLSKSWFETRSPPAKSVG